VLRSIVLGFALVLCLVVPSVAGAQQMADSTYHPVVARPAFTDHHPRVLFDEAHHNFHTLDGRYRPFADLLRSDGCALTPNTEPFSVRTLERHDLLVIANASGDDLDRGTEETIARSAFTRREIEAVWDWVQAGGSLFLIADHAPFGGAAAELAARLGVDMSQGYTSDSLQAAFGMQSQTFIEFTREAGSLGEHPVTNGRSEEERIDKIVAFTGQSLRGPKGSTSLMRLSDAAIDVPAAAMRDRGNTEAIRRAAVSAKGRSMGVAFPLGKGRVVVLAEAGMLTAQVVRTPDGRLLKFGMNRPGNENQQFALNTVRWLAREF